MQWAAVTSLLYNNILTLTVCLSFPVNILPVKLFRLFERVLAFVLYSLVHWQFSLSAECQYPSRHILTLWLLHSFSLTRRSCEMFSVWTAQDLSPSCRVVFQNMNHFSRWSAHKISLEGNKLGTRRIVEALISNCKGGKKKSCTNFDLTLFYTDIKEKTFKPAQINNMYRAPDCP